MAAKNSKTVANKKQVKAATTVGSKKSTTMEQIEKLEKALEKTKEEDVTNLVPEAIKEDVESGKSETEQLVDFEPVGFDAEVKRIIDDFDAEVKRVIETTEPSEEVKKQVEEFGNGKDEFNEKLEKNPQEAEKLLEDEIKRVEELKKKAEAIKANIQKENKREFKNSDFTNWWNGSSNLF